MEYNRKLLKEWANGEYWGDYIEREGGFKDDVITKQFKALEQSYFKEIERKINYCKQLLIQHTKDFFIYYTLAALSDRQNLDKDPKALYKRQAKFYCLKTLRLSPGYAPARRLLSEIESWLQLLGNKRAAKIPAIKIWVGGKEIT